MHGSTNIIVIFPAIFTSSSPTEYAVVRGTGAYQPDEDDYGYESKTATDMYSKLLQQYEKMPDKDYLKQKKKKVGPERSLDLAATKVRDCDDRGSVL